MNKLILAILLTCFTMPLLAQTGIFYDRTVRGEGVTIYEYDNIEGVPFRTMYFYTYGKDQCEISDGPILTDRECVTVTATATAECPDSRFPPFNPLCDPVVVEVTDTGCAEAEAQTFEQACDINGQRWFLGSDPINKDGDTIGKLYITEGLNFPVCVPSLDPFEEDVDICAELTLVGTYILRPAEEGGYYFWVTSVDDNHTDPLFDHTYEFTTPLILID